MHSAGEPSCSSCGNALRSEARFCDQCGVRVTPPRVEARVGGRSPRDYTPRHLAEKILTSRSALEGERKQVTVLFADVRSSMELAEQVDAEEWHEILDGLFVILTEGIHRFEGTVNQYTGDGIMALFGAPIAHEDHAQRACYAALHIRDELRGFAQQLKRERGLDLSVRIGLNSGQVVVGKIGDDLRMDYTGQGQVVHLAQRVEQLSEPERPYLTGATARLVRGYFELDELGDFAIKGASEPVEVCGLIGPGVFQTRLDASRARGLSRLVGRQAELGALDAALERALGGQGQVIAVVGDPGAGKSRLCMEFLERCRARGLATHQAYGLAHGAALPFFPIRALLRSHYGIRDEDSPGLCREKITARLLLLDDRFRNALPVIFEFLGVADPSQPAPQLDPEARERRLHALFRRFAERSREFQVILLEDLHWFDEGSERFVDVLVDAQTSGQGGLLILNYRPEYTARWTDRPHYQKLSLGRLSDEEVRSSLSEALGSDPSLRELPRLIARASGGNPLFIEEMIRSLLESGRLIGSPGQCRLAEPLDGLTVPDTIQALVASRIDRLQEGEKRALQAAAVIGREFPGPVLEAVLEQPHGGLDPVLARLSSAEFIFPRASHPVARYCFRHPLTREVAYGTQLREARSRLHEKAAQVLEAQHEADPGEHAALIAHHWEQAGRLQPASQWHRHAGEWAGLASGRESFRHWRKAYLLAAELDPSEFTDRLVIDASGQLLNLGWRLGSSTLPKDEAADVFAEGKRRAEMRGELSSLATLHAAVGAVLSTCWGDRDSLLAHSNQAIRVAEQGDDPAVLCEILLNRIWALLSKGRLEEAIACADRLLELQPPDATERGVFWGQATSASAMNQRACARMLQGELGEAERELELGEALAARAEDPEIQMQAIEYRVLNAYLRGVEDDLSQQAQALGLRKQIGGTYWAGRASAVAGMSHLLARRWSEAIREFEPWEASLNDFGPGGAESAAYLAGLAECQRQLGNLETALKLAQQGVSVGNTSAWTILGRAVLTRVLIDLEGAESELCDRSLREAYDLLASTGARAMAPILCEVTARLSLLRNDSDRRRRELRDAHALYTELGASGHAERIARVLAGSP